MIKLISFYLFISIPLLAQVSDLPEDATPVLRTDAPVEKKEFNPYKSHWLTSFGFEGLKYRTENDFRGIKRNYRPGNQELWGGRLGVGREIYFGGGINTTSRIEGYYVGTLFSQVQNGGAEVEDVKFSYTKKTGQVYGVDASQSIGMLFDIKTKHPIMQDWSVLIVEPYVEAGVGMARAFNRVNYSYDVQSTRESYRLRVSDELLNTKLAVGINFTATTGYFLYLKATQNRFDITQRSAIKMQKNHGETAPTSSKPVLDKNIAPIMTYAIGGGYKF